MRLDQYLNQQHPDHSRSYLQKLIADGQVKINGKTICKAGFKVSSEDKVKVNFLKAKGLELQAETIPLDVVFENKDLLIINKQAGIVVHPSDSGDHSSGTLVNAILAHCGKDLSGIGGVKRPGIVHRLDKDTSGLIMIAKNDQAHRYLSKIIAERKVTKTYLALVHGQIPSLEGTIDSPIGRDNRDRQKMSIQGDSRGKNALTHFRVLNYLKDLNISVLEVKIVTGRTHQIRVHMAALDRPVLFDNKYGNPKLDKELLKKLDSRVKPENDSGDNRQLLHAWKLELILPKQKEPQQFIAKVPEDIKVVIGNNKSLSF